MARFHWLLRCLCGMLFATSFAEEMAPWYRRNLEIASTADYTYRHSPSIASKAKRVPISLYGHFYRLALQVPYFDWWGEGGLLLAHGKDRAFGIDNAFLAGRYLLMDDTTGVDPFSLVVGGKLAFASKAALQDRASFHHGRLEMLLHISAGKEWSKEADWQQRIWGAALFGVADVGSPWLSLMGAWEKNRPQIDRLCVSLHFLYGTGHKTFQPRNFHGYGPINHRSLDIGVRYTRLLCEGQEAHFEYRRALYAYNFPRCTNSYSICLLYPFGL